MDACVKKLKKNRAIATRAKTISMSFGYHGDAITQLHNRIQHELQPMSILLYTKPFMKLCACVAGRSPGWSVASDVVAPLTRAKTDEVALKKNLKQLINNESAVRELRGLTADFASDIATEIDVSPEVILLINLTTLFLSLLDGDARITAVIRDNLICDAAKCK